MPRPANSFTHLAGVPVHYDRFQDPQFTYGTRGKPFRFHCTEGFQQKLEAFFGELWDVCPLGRAEVITSAGAYVDKPGDHGLGRGFDIDGIFWENRTFITKQYPQDRRFYLGVEAVLRKHFGTVLNFEFNAAHQDHFHIGDLSDPGFVAGHRSRVLFLQMILSHLFGRPVAVDGAIGRETNGAARDLLVDMNMASPQQIETASALHARLGDVWFTLLDRAAGAGFSETVATPAADPTPLELIEQVYAVVEHELGGQAARKRIETALTTFVNHDQTVAWLEQFRDDG